MKYDGDNCWYRGKVLNFEDEVVFVDFLDFGNVERVPLADIRDIPSSACRIPKVYIMFGKSS